MVTARINTPGTIGRVSVRPALRTTVVDPKFNPAPNVSIFEVKNVTTDVRQDGDTLIYDATTGNYISQPLEDVQVNIDNINGGSF